ncbi:phage repressor protein [Pantoea sp. ACRSB]|uniref:phage repressor protein n=1 Tax=Pantoea sp. ACRSB TaxID=2918207 RepID=UPI002892D8A2|nr:phage repressor protein [Pantoea sp. ACRSB]MCG7388736.1 phage repressor protein [Pantoea sp. ACRSB]
MTASFEPYATHHSEPDYAHFTSSSFRIETQDGFVIVDSAERANPGDEVAFQYDGYPMIGILFSSGLITPDGETLEGEVMDRIIVLGKVTATILDDEDPYRPTI